MMGFLQKHLKMNSRIADNSIIKNIINNNNNNYNYNNSNNSNNNSNNTSVISITK